MFLAALSGMLPGALPAGPQAATGIQAAATVIDDFDGYSQASYVQDQMWSLWRRFGSATTDGIYSIADGAEGRGASYGVNWALGNAGYVRHTFAAPKSFVRGTRFSIDLAVTESLPATQVCLLISDGDPARSTTTTYRTPPGIFITEKNYRTHAFELTEDQLRRVTGTASVREVLGRVANVTLMFSNPTGEGAQNIHFDNFLVMAASAP